MARKYKYYKLNHSLIQDLNLYRICENNSISVWRENQFQLIPPKEWPKHYIEKFFYEISEEELALEILNG